MQQVGQWTDDKHDQLRRYLSATRKVRLKFAESAFIDLFSGPGRVHVRERETTQLGSGLLAVQHQEAPFSRLLLCDLEPENAHALRTRTAKDQRVTVFEGDCNECIDDEMVGTTRWRDRVHGAEDAVRLIDVLREQLVSLGYEDQAVRSLPITNSQNGLLYHLMFASKDQLGSKIWDSLSRHSRSQRGFPF